MKLYVCGIIIIIIIMILLADFASKNDFEAKVQVAVRLKLSQANRIISQLSALKQIFLFMNFCPLGCKYITFHIHVY